MQKTEHEQAPDRKRRVPVVSYLVMWLISVIVIFLDILSLRMMALRIAAWHAARTITTTAERIEFNFRISFIDRALLFVMAIAGLGVVIWLERRYRTLAEQHELFSKGWKIVAILVGIGLFSLIVRLLF